MKQKIIILTILIFTTSFLPLFAGVIKDGNLWRIEENSLTVEFDELTFDVDVKKAGSDFWRMDRTTRNQEIVIQNEAISLASAGTKQFQQLQDGNRIGVQATLRDFRNLTNIEIQILVYVDTERGELIIEIDPVNDSNMYLQECRYPRGFRLERDGANAYVNPSGSDAYGSLDILNRDINFEDENSYAHHKLFMAWWGLLRNYSRDGRKGEGLVAMVATPYDFSLNAFTENNYTVFFGKWRESLGRLRYPRKMCYALFSADCDYVAQASRYRQFLIDEGRFKTLREKAQINPNVNKLLGTAQFTQYITQCYDEGRTFSNTFYNAKRQAAEFHSRFKNPPHFMVHIREWHEGELSEGGTPYDLNVNGPNLEAGGWEGLKELSDWCDETDNFLYLYDTYNDIAKTDELSVYNTDMVIRNAAGNIWAHNWWCGSLKFAMVCPVKRMALFRHNLEILQAHGINIKAIYLDITVIREPRECYNTEHDHGRFADPVTGHLSREGYCLAIKEFYEWCAENGIIVLSEEPVEWAWSFVLGSFFFIPRNGKVDNGRYIPLIHLVGHDAIIGGDYIDTYHTGSDPRLFMKHLSHGVFPIPRENLEDDAIQSEKICDLHRHVGFERMINHEFVNGKNYLQRTTFSNGTTVEVNYNTGEYDIQHTVIPIFDTIPPNSPVNVIVRRP